jgi:hypothetical protein
VPSRLRIAFCRTVFAVERTSMGTLDMFALILFSRAEAAHS